jgi:CubicO group peptidase (beta-lactamase class C family)
MRAMNFAAVLLCPALLVACATESSTASDRNVHNPPGEELQGQAAALDACIREAMHDWHVPGLAITIVKDGSVWFSRGYGVRRVGSPEPVDPHTNFGLLSPTKTFTTTALAMLIDEGRLSWDDRVVDHLPEFRLSDPDVTREVRVRDIVSHRTGYPDSPWLWYMRRLGRDRLLERLPGISPAAPYGTEFHYNNLLYIVAAEVIEAVSGLTWEEFVRQRIFTPLGMNESTTSVRAVRARANVASPHARRILKRWGPVRPIGYLNFDNVGPAGGIHTNVAEMAAWLQFHLGDGEHDGRPLLSASRVRELRQPQIRLGDLSDEQLGGDRAFAPLRGYLGTIDYGLGWFVTEFRGRPAVFHGGGITGQRSAVGLLPEENAGVVILSNMHHTEIALALMFQVFDLFLDTEPRDWSGEYLGKDPTGRTQCALVP